MDTSFYTYAHLREDGTPYYVGKGTGNRAWRKRKFRPPDNRILILKKNLTEEEAFRHEVYMIFVLGRKDLGTGILRNRTNGGEGTSGAIVNELGRLKRSRYWKGRKRDRTNYILAGLRRRGEKKKPWTAEQKEKLKGRPHPLKGKEMPEEWKQNISRARKGKPWSEARRNAQRKKSQS